MITTGVVGVGGRMGSLIAGMVAAAPDLELKGALEATGNPLIGRDLGDVLRCKPLGVLIADSPAAAFRDCRVIIDFSIPAATLKNAAFAAENKTAMVIGTTGFSEAERALIAEKARMVPIVMAPNMSIGVNVMFKVAGLLTELLGEDYDIEIVEAHHRHKKDSPSGTADGLAREIARARGVDLAACARYERHGMIGERPRGEIGIQTMRAGDIVGDHTVMFAGGGERIELTHRAHSRENFARGAMRAAAWVARQEPGLYSMMDVIGF